MVVVVLVFKGFELGSEVGEGGGVDVVLFFLFGGRVHRV